MSIDATLARLRGLDDQQLVDEVAGVCEQIRALQALQAAQLTEVDSRIRALGYPMSGSAEQVAVTLVVSPRSAENLLGTSVVLCDRAVVWTALAEGRIDWTKASRILDDLADIPDPRRAEFETAAVDYGASHTAHELHRRLLAWTCTGDEEESLRRESMDRRTAGIYARGHGMADIYAHVSAEHAEAFMQALDQLAAAPDLVDPYKQGESRSAEQRRADALVGFLESHCTFNINVDVVISADTLIGDNEYGAELGRLGPVTSELARALCWSPDARWRRLVTDPMTGRLVDMSADHYRIPERIRSAVKKRDRFCRFPGCHRPAEHADIDHIVAWPRGRTHMSNLGGLCRHHHRVKTHSAWKVKHRPGSSRFEMTWTSPLGTTHTTTAHDYHRRD